MREFLENLHIRCPAASIELLIVICVEHYYGIRRNFTQVNDANLIYRYYSKYAKIGIMITEFERLEQVDNVIELKRNRPFSIECCGSQFLDPFRLPAPAASIFSFDDRRPSIVWWSNRYGEYSKHSTIASLWAAKKWWLPGINDPCCVEQYISSPKTYSFTQVGW